MYIYIYDQIIQLCAWKENNRENSRILQIVSFPGHSDHSDVLLKQDEVQHRKDRAQQPALCCLLAVVGI